MTIVISFLNQKGGSGKTTLATNIAHGLTLLGHKTLLVDADPQGSTRDWHEANEGELVTVLGLDRETLPKDLEAIKGNYEYVIIDGAGRSARLSAAAVCSSDVVLIPVQPSPYDVWATAELVDQIKTRQLVNKGLPKAAFILSRVVTSTKIGKEVGTTLQEYEFPVFESFTTQRIIYAVSANTGDSVFKYAGSPACEEVRNIIDEIKEMYGYV